MFHGNRGIERQVKTSNLVEAFRTGELTESELADFRLDRDRFVDDVVKMLGVDREAIQHFGEI